MKLKLTCCPGMEQEEASGPWERLAARKPPFQSNLHLFTFSKTDEEKKQHNFPVQILVSFRKKKASQKNKIACTRSVLDTSVRFLIKVTERPWVHIAWTVNKLCHCAVCSVSFKSIVSFSALLYQKLSPVTQGEALSQICSHLVLILSPQNHMLREVCWH